MMCCDNIENLGCFNSCVEFIDTGIVAVNSEKLKLEIEFFSTKKCDEIDVIENENIKIPNKLNEHNTHIIRFYNSSNELLNNTCYKLKTIPCSSL